MNDIDTIISLHIGANFALLGILLLLFGLVKSVAKIQASLDKQNELKEKELKAKYPDKDIQ